MVPSRSFDHYLDRVDDDDGDGADLPAAVHAVSLSLEGRICCRTVERQDINLTTTPTPTSCLFMLLLVLGSIWRGSGGQRRERVTKEVS